MSSNEPSRPTVSLGAAFNRAAQWTAEQCGRASTFAIACVIIVVWAATGPVFHYSDTWQLIINTGTTIVTFLMVFLIQNTQNRDSAVLHLKLDELIRVTQSARNGLLDLDGVSEKDLKRMKRSFARLAGQPPDGAALRDVAGDLDTAGEGIQGAAEKLASVAGRRRAAANDAER